MKARYEVDRNTLGDMDVTLAITMKLGEWEKLAGALREGKWHADSEQFGRMIMQMHDTHMSATAGSYTSTAYRTDHEDSGEGK